MFPNEDEGEEAEEETEERKGELWAEGSYGAVSDDDAAWDDADGAEEGEHYED